MVVDVRTLSVIAAHVIFKIRAMHPELFRTMLIHEEYHDFGKDDFSGNFIPNILRHYNLTTADVQVDIISVDRDLTHQIHYHERAHAFITVLGQEEYMPTPKTAECYLDGEWSKVSEGAVVSIPPCRRHGFRVQSGIGDILHFLSVQSPPIVGDVDDYHQV